MNFFKEDTTNFSEELLQNPDRKNPKKALLFFILLLMLILILIITPFIFFNDKTSINKKIETKTINFIDKNFLVIDTSIKENVFIDKVPFFEKLDYQNLPQTYDIRNAYNYKSNLIIAGFNKIIIYSPTENKIIKQNNPHILDCLNSSTLIDNFLYVLCYGNDSKRGLFVVDLDNNKIIKSYHDKLKIPLDKFLQISREKQLAIPTLLNGRVTGKNNNVWIGAWNGVFKIDTKTDEVNFYKNKDMGFSEGCQSFRAYSNRKTVLILPVNSSNCEGGLTLFDDSNNLWKNFKVNDFDVTDDRKDINLDLIAYSENNLYLSYILESSKRGLKMRLTTYDWKDEKWIKVIDYFGNEGYKKFRNTILSDTVITFSGEGSTTNYSYIDKTTGKPIDSVSPLPSYLGISQLLNNKYYLFSNNGIYVLEKEGFPKLLFPVQIKNSYVNEYSKFFVNEKEEYAVLIGRRGGMDLSNPTLRTELYADYIDLKSGKITNMISRSNGLDKPIDDKLQEILTKIRDSIVEEKSDTLILRDSNSEEELFFINLQSKQLIFNL